MEKKHEVAIKKIYNVFEQDREYQKRILREVKILRHFIGHPNLVALTDIIAPRTFHDFRDVYIGNVQITSFFYFFLVTELMNSDLRSLIKSDQEFEDQDTQYFIYQIIKGLKYIHSANVLHR